MQRADLVAAAREAGDAGFDVLIACAFNYEAHTTEFNKLGRIPVLKARMNADLHMAGDLKNTGKGNLFVIFGEPDITLLPEPDGQLRVKVNGVDVFHPNTGEVRSDGADGIACWFIDTDYNEESFFVRHAYFLGANDPYSALKTTLKAEIDAEAWATLNSDTSRPFDKPKIGPHRREGDQPSRRRGDEGVPGQSSAGLSRVEWAPPTLVSADGPEEGGRCPPYENLSENRGSNHGRNGVAGRLAQEDPAHFLGGLGTKLDEPLDAVKRRVWRQKDAGMAAQSVVVEWLALDDVERRGGDPAGIERFEKRLLIDDRPRAVLIRYEPGRIRARAFASIRWCVVASR